MKTHDNRSEFVAHESQRERAPWTLPSRCNRPAPAKSPTLLYRLLKFLGVK